MSRAPKRFPINDHTDLARAPLDGCSYLWRQREVNWGLHERIIEMLRRCVSHHKPPLLFLIFMAWQTAEGIASFTRHRSRQRSSCVNANLSVLNPGYARDHTAGELTEPDKRPTPAALYTSHPRVFSFEKRSQTSNALCRALIDQFFTHVDASPTSTPPRKIPSPEWEELPDLPPDLPPHPPANVVNQVNTRDALTLHFMSSEAMVDGLGYDILNAE